MGQPGDERSDWPPLAVDVPDDIRELAPDIAAYHREQRQNRRRDLLDRLIPLRRQRRFGLIGPIGVGVLVLVAAVGSLLALLVPATPSRPIALPLAQPEAPTGTVGGLLPDFDIVDAMPGGAPVAARSFRPAVFLFLPAGCPCSPIVARLAGETDAYGLRLVLVTATEADRSAVTDLAAVPGHGGVAAQYDASGVLTATYLRDGATGPTAVLVHADGIVSAVVPDVGASTRLPTLSTLDRAGARASG